MRKFSLLLVLLACTSCGIFRFRSSERYLPGPAIRDYTPEGIVEEVLYPSCVPGPGPDGLSVSFGIVRYTGFSI